MSKDTIYIDVDDDITAIIGKIKNSGSKVIAMVPPKRPGVLQSAVNLRLLASAARQNNKHLVLISGNSALTMLAAAAKIPSAKNLQSKPELVSLPDTGADEEDVIEGSELPIGELARTAESGVPPEDVSPAVDLAIRDNIAEEPKARADKPTRNSNGSKVRVPDFNTFRKKFALIIGALILLVGFSVWAIWFAPSAKIIITARTIESSANPKVTISPTVTTDLKANTIKATRVEVKKDASVEFEATGSKEVGEKSKGQVVFQNCETEDPQTIPSGTGISAGGKTYITQASAVVPSGQGSWISGCTPGESEPVAVVAQDIGEDYNTDEGTRFNVAGHSNSSSFAYFRAVASTDISGGSKKTIKVVSAEDIAKASDQLIEQNNKGIKDELTAKFDDNTIAVNDSVNADKANIKSVPAEGAEATDGKAKLSGVLTFTMLGVTRDEASKFLDAYFTNHIEEKDTQRVYDDGADKASFTNVSPADDGSYSATVVATAKFGPKIDDEAVKSEAKGKRYGEIQSSLESISGVENVDIEFSPFWVSVVPDDNNRIIVQFKLDESK